MNCIYCNSKKTQKRGSFPRQRYQCRNCGRWFYGESSIAKILVFDIETLPMKVFTWRLFDPVMGPKFIIQDSCILGWTGKWLFKPTHTSRILTPKEAVAYDDKRIVQDAWRMLNDADIVIAHNGINFDIRRCNARFILHDLPPTSPYLTIDTKETAKRAFGFSSNKLDYLGRYLGLGAKLHDDSDFELWRQCAGGNPDALREMREYNEQDTYLLEDVYVKLRPYIKHPNMSLYVEAEGNVCGKCGSDDLDIDRDHPYRTSASVFESFRCNHCGAIGRKDKRYRTSKTRMV